jgi:hypothetical protein
VLNLKFERNPTTAAFDPTTLARLSGGKGKRPAPIGALSGRTSTQQYVASILDKVCIAYSDMQLATSVFFLVPSPTNVFFLPF